MKQSPILVIAAQKQGMGGGHLSRSIYLVQNLRSAGRDAYLFEAPEAWKELAPPAPIDTIPWSFIVIDGFRTDPEIVAFFGSLAPLVGIDEGGPCRQSFDFLVDILPALPRSQNPALKPNITNPRLLPLPEHRRTSFYSNYANRDCAPANRDTPPRLETLSVNQLDGEEGTKVPNWYTVKTLNKILVSFGAEDQAGLSLPCIQGLIKMGEIRTWHVSLVAGPLNRTLTPEIRDDLRKRGVRILDSVSNLKEELADYDLVVTHYGLTAFEALYARVPVLLVAPTTYHEALGRSAGFMSAGRGPKGAARVSRILSRYSTLEELVRRSVDVYTHLGFNAGSQSLAALLADWTFPAGGRCPFCRTRPYGKKTQARSPREPMLRTCSPVLARFEDRTYRRCHQCGMVYMERPTEPPIIYDGAYFLEDYKRQYGKTYIEDLPHLKEMARNRLQHIENLLVRSAGWQAHVDSSPPAKSPRGYIPIQTAIQKDNRPTQAASSTSNRSPAASSITTEGAFPDTTAIGRPIRVLDIGCAYGAFLSAATDLGWEVYGLDPSADAVQFVQQELGLPALQGLFPEADVWTFGGKQPFDVISLWYVIEHITDLEAALHSIRSLLRPGGILAFSTPSFGGISGRTKPTVFLRNSPADHWTIWEPAHCAALL
ncbi:MAG: methyltransferase domain-containing protein, partial [Termitinemataceae bacterium]